MNKNSYILILFFAAFMFMYLTGSQPNFTNIKIENSEVSLSDHWYKSICEDVERTEYDVSYSKERDAYQAANRANNLRYYFYENGFEAESRDGSKDFQIKLTLLSFGKKEELLYCGGVIDAANNKVFVSGKMIDVEYIHDKRGLKQNFIVKSKPEGNENLEINIKAGG